MLTLRYSLLILDFDGTLVNLSVPWGVLRKEILQFVVRHGAKVDLSQHLSIVCDQLSVSPWLKCELDNIFHRLEQECVSQERYATFPELLILLAVAHRMGIRLAIASSNHTDTLRAVLQQLGIATLFSAIVGRDQVRWNKPAPEQLELILATTRVIRTNALLVGDSDNDREAARAIGVDFLKVQAGSGADVELLRQALGLPPLVAMNSSSS